MRAANIAELFAPVTPGTGDLLVDPCANGRAGSPLTGGLRALCIATGVPATAIDNATLAQPTSGQVNAFFGGNPNLTPEEADTVTFGVVWQPDFVPGLAVTVDYYDIQIANAISIRPNYDIVDGCYNITRNPTLTATDVGELTSTQLGALDSADIAALNPSATGKPVGIGHISQGTLKPKRLFNL